MKLANVTVNAKHTHTMRLIEQLRGGKISQSKYYNFCMAAAVSFWSLDLVCKLVEAYNCLESGFVRCLDS